MKKTLIASATIITMLTAGALTVNSEAASSQQTSTKTRMNLVQIASGNLGSIKGTWNNAQGKTLTITDKSLTYYDDEQSFELGKWPFERLNDSFVGPGAKKAADDLPNEIQLSEEKDAFWPDKMCYAHGFLTFSSGLSGIDFIPKGSYTVYDGKKGKQQIEIKQDAISPFTDKFFVKDQFYYRVN